MVFALPRMCFILSFLLVQEEEEEAIEPPKTRQGETVFATSSVKCLGLCIPYILISHFVTIDQIPS